MMPEQEVLDRLLFESGMALEYDAMRRLLAAGADPNARNGMKDTPLHVAASYFNVEVCRILLENGADVNIRGLEGNTPLHSLFRGMKYDPADGFEGEEKLYPPIIELFLAWGADPDIENDAGCTARDLASTEFSDLMPGPVPAGPRFLPARLRKMLGGRPPVPGL